MVTVYILYATFGKLQARMAIFSIKIDAATSRDICDLSNVIQCHAHGNGEQNKGDVREIASRISFIFIVSSSPLLALASHDLDIVVAVLKWVLPFAIQPIGTGIRTGNLAPILAVPHHLAP